MISRSFQDQNINQMREGSTLSYSMPYRGSQHKDQAHICIPRFSTQSPQPHHQLPFVFLLFFPLLPPSSPQNTTETKEEKEQLTVALYPNRSKLALSAAGASCSASPSSCRYTSSSAPRRLSHSSKSAPNLRASASRRDSWCRRAVCRWLECSAEPWITTSIWTSSLSSCTSR